MNPELIYPLICIGLCLTCVLAYHWGKDRGIIAERIRLTGSSLPRFENPPPMPDKYGWTPIEIRQPEYYKEVLAHLEDGGMCIVWRASDGQKDIYTIQCSDLIVDPIYWRPLPDFIIPKRVGAPTMPNHPDMPVIPRWVKAGDREPSIGDYYYCKVDTKQDCVQKVIVEWARHLNGIFPYWDWDLRNAGDFGEDAEVIEWLDEIEPSLEALHRTVCKPRTDLNTKGGK